MVGDFRQQPRKCALEILPLDLSSSPRVLNCPELSLLSGGGVGNLEHGSIKFGVYIGITFPDFLVLVPFVPHFSLTGLNQVIGFACFCYMARS